eukprot:scaffold30832_cov67-Phaeocystis_antarctica.AAC.8
MLSTSSRTKAEVRWADLRRSETSRWRCACPGPGSVVRPAPQARRQPPRSDGVGRERSVPCSCRAPPAPASHRQRMRRSCVEKAGAPRRAPARNSYPVLGIQARRSRARGRGSRSGAAAGGAARGAQITRWSVCGRRRS